MAAAHELLVVHTENGVIAVQEVRVENDFDAIMGMVEELNAPNLVQDRVVGVVSHIVSGHRWECVALQGEDAALKQNPVLIRKELLRGGESSALTGQRSTTEDAWTRRL